MSEQVIWQRLLLAYFVAAPVIAGSLFWITAPYGRQSRGGWGPTLPPRAAWVLMELPAVVVIAATALWAPAGVPAATWLLLALWETHYLYRTFIFPFLGQKGGRAMPLSVALMGFVFNIGNGYLNGRGLFEFAAPSADFLYQPRFWVGVGLFVTGFVIHVHSDHVFRTLRAPGETGYKIPNRGLHRWVAAPNYFGELVQWSGFALASWSPAGLAFVLWTLANLGPRAVTHWQWYRATFPDYPRGRRALVPGVL